MKTCALVLDILTVSPVFRTMDDRPHNINATNGDAVTVSCKVAAEPRASIVWLRNGVPLQCMLLYFICFYTSYSK